MNNILRKLDLNLLVTLDALLAEHNVTRAAQRLHLSQPSVSVQLGKLRDALGDPLLLPGPRGMLPTTRANELRTPLRQTLHALEQVVAPPRPFNPAEASHTWRIMASDYSESTIVVPALAALRAKAPMTRLAVLGIVPPLLYRQAELGEIDLAFHVSDDAPDALHQRLLFKDHYVLAGRAGHPRLRRRPSLDRFCKLDHVMTSPDGGGFHGVSDIALSRVGLKRTVSLSVPHFLALRSILTSTDMVAVLPSRLARGDKGLRVVAPPIDVPGFEILMLWHDRVHRDPAHQWLREHIAASVSGQP